MALERLKRNLRLHPPFRLGPSVRLEEGGAALASQSPRIGAVAGIISPSACALRQDASYSPSFLARGVQFENAMTAMTKAYFIAVAPTSGLRIGHDQGTSGSRLVMVVMAFSHC